MKIISQKTGIQYDISDFLKSGENDMVCPECSKDRKKKNVKSFRFNGANKLGYCHHCNTSFYEFKPAMKTEKVYTKPKPPKETKCTAKAIEYFESRKISRTTIDKMKIYSSVKYMNKFQKEVEVICFPYYKENELITIKYRAAQKTFEIAKDSELIWYNFDALTKYDEVIIVEGEFDALSWIGAGFENVISVPNGTSKSEDAELTYVTSSFEYLEKIKKFYIATDNDSAGIMLRNNLIVRLGSEKCNIVNFKDCKDSNEYAQKYGGFELGNLLKEAYEVPVEGILNMNNEYDNVYTLFMDGLKPGKFIGIKELDNIISWETKRLTTVSGIPGSGKSEYVDFIVSRLNAFYGWKVAYFSPENYPFAYHYAKIFSKVCGLEFNKNELSLDYFNEIYDYISDNYSFIVPEKDMKIETILQKAEYLVKKQGIKILVIDPYNTIEHVRQKNETETDYVSRLLSLLANFAKKNDLLIFLVAHPRKLASTNVAPGPYDIAGSANFFNKSDYVVSVIRNDTENFVEIQNQKVKFRNLGKPGAIKLQFNEKNGRFHLFGEYPDNNSLINFKLKVENEIDNIWGDLPNNKDFDNKPLPF